MNAFFRILMGSMVLVSMSFLAPVQTGRAAVAENPAFAGPGRGWTWQIETVDPSAGLSTALALDGDDSPLVAYQAPDPGLEHDLRLATWMGWYWYKDTIALKGDTGWLMPSLELDSSDQPHVGYYVCNM